MGEKRSLHGFAVDIGHTFAGYEVQTVGIVGLLLDDHFTDGLVEGDDSLKQDTLALLDVLAHGVKVRGEDGGCRVNALAVLALALSEELFEPLIHHGKRGLIGDEHFNVLALAEKDIPESGVFIGVVLLEIRVGQGVLCVTGALHKTVNVNACHGNGKKAYCGENRVATADVVGNNKCLVALFVCQRFQCALLLVGGGIDALGSFLLAVFLHEHFAEYAEGDGGLGRRAGFRDNIHRKVFVGNKLLHFAERGGADGVAGEKDLRCVFCQ